MGDEGLERQMRRCSMELDDVLAGQRGLEYSATPVSTDRALLHAELVADLLDEARETPREGLAAVVMAGVPGAGKSQSLQGRTDLDGYFTLDADIIKSRLLDHPMTRDRFEEVLTRRLSDGLPVKPEELATLVHHESTRIYDLVVNEVIRAGHNVILDGTLQWPGQGPRLAAALRAGDYESVEFIAVEVPQDVAQRQALTRWWTGRTDPTRPNGGRYTPASVITAMYPVGSDQSVCLTRAIDAFNLADTIAFPRATLTIHNRHGRGPGIFQRHRDHGHLDGPELHPSTVLGLDVDPSQAGPPPLDPIATRGQSLTPPAENPAAPYPPRPA